MKTVYQANKDIGYSFGRRNNTIPSTYYIGLSVSPDISETGFTEPTGGGYARVALANSTANFSSPVNGRVSVTEDVTFPMTTSALGIVYAVGIFDSASGGHLLYYDRVNTSKYIADGVVLTLKAGAVVIASDS